MNKVEPIRDLKKIQCMKETLRQNNKRNYMMFLIGINTALRVSDLLNLKVKDVKNKKYIKINESKTGKVKKQKLNDNLITEIKKYIKGKDDEEYLFKSQKGENRPISRIQAYKILNNAAKKCKLDEVGTHTMRKTYAYWHYKRFNDIVTLQEELNHSHPSITLRYIGINQDIRDSYNDKFYL